MTTLTQVSHHDNILNYNIQSDIFEVILTPCNENQSMNYGEPFKGTIKNILFRSWNIVRGLKQLFPHGDFSVMIEDLKYTQTLFVDNENLYNSKNEHICPLNQILK